MPKLPAVPKLEGKLQTGEVWMNGRPPSPQARSLEVASHGPAGVRGIRGQDPRSSLFPIPLSYLSEKEAVTLYRDFKFKFIARKGN